MPSIVYDFLLKGVQGGTTAPQGRQFDVHSGAAATITAGDLLIIDGGNPGYVLKGTNGASSTSTWIGMATDTSTDTVAADGVVHVVYAPEGLLCEGTATTPANLTQARELTRVTLDVAGGNQTVDEDDTVNGILEILPDLWNATTGRVVVSVPYFNSF